MKKILIIEDEALIAMDLKLQLENNGFEITDTIMRENQIQKSIEKQLPDIIIIDIFLKGKPVGLDIAETINKSYHLPHLFTTGNSDRNTKEKALATHPLGYFLKPINIKDIVELIQNQSKQTI